MTILEILGRHIADVCNHGDIECRCGEQCDTPEAHRTHLAEVLGKHMQEREAQLRQLVRDMTDSGACWFDHHGGCQEHGYLELRPGELCPHAEAKQLLGMEEPNSGR